MAELYFGPDDDQAAELRVLLDLADDPRDVNYQVGYGKPHVQVPDELIEKYHAAKAEQAEADKPAPRKRAGAKKAAAPAADKGEENADG